MVREFEEVGSPSCFTVMIEQDGEMKQKKSWAGASE